MKILMICIVVITVQITRSSFLNSIKNTLERPLFYFRCDCAARSAQAIFHATVNGDIGNCPGDSGRWSVDEPVTRVTQQI